MAVHEFRNRFPEVQLVEDRIIIDEQGLYSSGGAFSYLNLILYLIEKYVGRQVAVFMSKAFQIEPASRPSLFSFSTARKNSVMKLAGKPGNLLRPTWRNVSRSISWPAYSPLVAGIRNGFLEESRS
jgi:hypothetical protein